MDQSRLHLPRRQFLRSAGAALIAPLGAPLVSQAGDLATVSIYFTTDLHGHILPTVSYGGWENVGGLARCATQIRKWRKENPHSLLIDIGDVYQGTHVSKSSDGRLMIDLLNKLDYDAWVIGNHEFDWGLPVLADAVKRSAMPVLSSNAEIGGHSAWNRPGKDDTAMGKIRPYIIKEVSGFKIAIIGATTPGLPYWLHRELLQDFTATPPAVAVRDATRAARAEGADAVIVAGHMGMKNDKDDYANPVRQVIDQSEPDAFIAGHTHKDMASMSHGKTLYTQASYHGLHAGRLDLAFSRDERTLVDKRAFTVLMDDRFDLDPIVIDGSKKAVSQSSDFLSKPVGRLSETLSTDQATRLTPSRAHRLLGSAIKHALRKTGAPVDAVFHGLFSDDPIPKGEVTHADLWKLIPYENMLLTAKLNGAQLKAIIKEDLSVYYSSRVLMGTVQVSGKKGEPLVIKRKSGSQLRDDDQLTVAFNAYDAQSGGKKLIKLRRALEEPEAAAKFYKTESREALVHFFMQKKEISPSDLTV